MRVYGEEGVRRVERHRKLRAGKGFQTAECPVKVDEAFAQVCMSSLWNRHVTYHMEEYVRQNF